MIRQKTPGPGNAGATRPDASGPRRQISRRLAPVALAVLASLSALGPVPALAFDPFPVAGGPGEHRRILDAALGCPSGTGPSCWTLAARDRFEPSLRRPDITAITVWNPAHCDSGDPAPEGRSAFGRRGPAALSACRDWIRVELEASVRAADRLVDGRGAPRSVRGTCGTFLLADADALCDVDHHLGRALHAAQDFYAHTNWTDRRRAPADVSLHAPQGLDGEGPIPWLAADNRDPPPAGLMSGCFVFFPESLFCQGRTRHEDLNKDRRSGPGMPPIGGTPRGGIDGNFARAFEAASGETGRIWRDLQGRLIAAYGETRGRAMACVIRGGDASECTRPPAG